MIKRQTQQSKSVRWSETYSVLSIIMLSTSPSIFLGDGNRNLGLIAFIFSSPLFLTRCKISTELMFLLGFAVFIVLSTAIFQVGDARWSTVFYSLMFCTFFFVYQSRLRAGFLRINTLLTCIRYVILAYTLVLLIQQLCVLLNLPIFNVSNYDPSERWKLNALASEPSHSARIVGLCMITFVLGERLSRRLGMPLALKRKQINLLWLCFLWTMITMISSTSVVMLIIVALVKTSNLKLRSFLPGLVFFIVVLLVIPEKITSRTTDMLTAFMTLDYESVLIADHSGGLRVAPMLVLGSNVEIFSLTGLFGNGIDSASLILSRYIWGVEDGFSGGALLQLWYEYGFIAFLLFVLFSLTVTRAIKSFGFFLIWFFLVFLGSVNTQILWLTICLIYTLNYFDGKAAILERRQLRKSLTNGATIST